MKGLLVMLVLALIFAGVVIWYTSHQMGDTPDEYIAIAFGDPAQDTIQMDMAVSIAMPRREPPRIDPQTGAVYWDEWVEKHFVLKDSAGVPVRFQRFSLSRLMTDQEVGGSPEFFLKCRLKKDAPYVFVYIPVIGGGEAFRYEFTAPADTVYMERARFRLIEEPVP